MARRHVAERAGVAAVDRDRALEEAERKRELIHRVEQGRDAVGEIEILAQRKVGVPDLVDHRDHVGAGGVVEFGGELA